LQFFETRCKATSVAAPDHKIRQCIQRSALFPKYADGGTEGATRGSGARSAGVPTGWVWGKAP